MFLPENFPSQESLKEQPKQTEITPNVSAFIGYIGTVDTREINLDKDTVGPATLSDERLENKVQEMEDEDCGPITMSQLDVHVNPG